MTFSGGRDDVHRDLAPFVESVEERLVEHLERAGHQLARQSSVEWPHAYARFDVGADEFLSRYRSNHLHAVPADVARELEAVCEMLNIDFEHLGA